MWRLAVTFGVLPSVHASAVGSLTMMRQRYGVRAPHAPPHSLLYRGAAFGPAAYALGPPIRCDAVTLYRLTMALGAAS